MSANTDITGTIEGGGPVAPRIVVYSKPTGCQQCIATIRKLDEHGVVYEKRDATSASALSFIRDELGHREAPVVLVYDDFGRIVRDWSGYRPDMLDTLKAA